MLDTRWRARRAPTSGVGGPSIVAPRVCYSFPVTALRYRLKSIAWLALLAMCGLAVGPSISRALGADAMASDSVHAHCMEMGAHAQMAADAQGLPVEQPGTPARNSGKFLDCCALCAVAATPFSIVAVVVPQWSPPENASAPLLDHSGARPAAAELWPSAAPRGPPLRS